jgi:hypothetical protein
MESQSCQDLQTPNLSNKHMCDSTSKSPDVKPPSGLDQSPGVRLTRVNTWEDFLLEPAGAGDGIRRGTNRVLGQSLDRNRACPGPASASNPAPR